MSTVSSVSAPPRRRRSRRANPTNPVRVAIWAEARRGTHAFAIDRFDSIARRFQKIYVNTLFTYTLVGYTATTATRDDDDDDDDDDDVHSHRLID